MSPSNRNKTRALITGARGLIGRHALSAAVAEFDEVHATTSGRIGDGESDVCWHHVDLLNPAQAARLISQVRPTHLLHLAWTTEPRKYWTSPDNLSWVEASLRLVHLFAEHGGERLVLAGSCAEYEAGSQPCNEIKTPLVPATLYGWAKHTLAQLAAAFARQQGISFANTRTFNVYGPGEPSERLVPSIVLALLAGRVARCTHPWEQRDFLHAYDVGRAHAALLASDLGGAVNVASGRTVAVGDIAKWIAEALGRPDLLDLQAAATQTSDNQVIVADTTRLRDELGFRPHFDLHQGLSDTLSWWKAPGNTACIAYPIAPSAAAPLTASC